MGELFNLIVDLDDGVAVTREPARSLAGSVNGVNFVASDAASETVLAWIDEEFGGCWSSEAHAASNALAFRDGPPVGFAAFDPQGLRFAWLRGVAREPGVGVFGPFGVAASQRGKGIGRALLQFALAGLRERGYARALIAAVGEERLGYYGEALGARVVEQFDRASAGRTRRRASWYGLRQRDELTSGARRSRCGHVADRARRRRGQQPAGTRDRTRA